MLLHYFVEDGTKIFGNAVVITTGTFLKGQINIGLEKRPAGRMDDEPSIGLADTLYRLGFKIGRLKTGKDVFTTFCKIFETSSCNLYFKRLLAIYYFSFISGTPPRLEKESIDFTKCKEHLPDKSSIPFSFMSDKVWLSPNEQVSTYLTHTNANVAKIIRDNMHCNLHVTEEVTGPRYCPSIESKVLRFATTHQIWLEPEGLDSPLIYPSGLSCTLPEEKQVELVKCIPGLENARMGNYYVQFYYRFSQDEFLLSAFLYYGVISNNL